MTDLTPADPTIDVTVCVVNWNGARWLPDCLDSLCGVQGIRQEVIVVDNGSSDESIRIIHERYPEVRLLVNNQNLGFAKGNNQAIRLGRGRHFFILNNDTVLGKGSLEALVRFLEGRPKAGIVAGHLVNDDGSTQFEYYPVSLPTVASLTVDLLWVNRIWPRHRLGRGALARRWDPARSFRMEQVPGACMLVRREALESSGLFDEAYNFFYEDVDLCARCRRAGWEIWYVPEAKIMHRGAASTKLLPRAVSTGMRFRNMMRYARKHFTRGQHRTLEVVVALVLMLRLPLVVMASHFSKSSTRRDWKGTWRTYWQLLQEIVRGRASGL
jgi:N-acetylglucosaminyl-diphospho-decaprenol L-rhamnosyltransferase